MMYMLGGLAAGAVLLALVERRKKRQMRVDLAPDALRDPARAAYTDAEKIRAEAQIAHPPQGGGIF